MSDDSLSLRKADGVGWLTLNDPHRRNALSEAMCEAMIEALSDLDADPGVRLCVITGAGGAAFASGANIGEFKADGVRRPEPPAISRIFTALETFSKPSIAMIRGWCLGGGLALAMKADLRIADATAKFGVPAAKLGLAYPVDSVRDLVNLVGPAKAKLILYTGENLDADKAFACGLVDEVVASEALTVRIDQLAAAIVRNAPLSIVAAKAAIEHLTYGRHSEAEVANLVVRCFKSDDFSEGRAAFLEKRTPVFRGL